MISIKPLTAMAIVFALAGCGQNEPIDTGGTQILEAGAELLGEAMLANAAGEAVGSALLIEIGNALVLDITIDGLDPGERAFHLHTTGLCEAPNFTSAGGHLNPFQKLHGQMSEGGKHLGDLPNIDIVKGEPFSRAVTLDGKAEDLKPLLFDQDGTSVMIHAGPDDYASDPAGNAGPRIACGVLEPAT